LTFTIPFIDETQVNPEWDQFVVSSDTGTFYQTSSWAQVKKAQGWNALRAITKSSTGDICGGCQVLYKKLFGIFYLIQLPKGPIYEPENLEMALSILDEIKRFFQRHPYFLIIQPGDTCWDLMERLLHSGYGTDLKVDLEEKATIIFDVSKDREEILKKIKKRKRSQFRQSETRGLQFFESNDRQDLETFHSMHKRVAEKRDFDIQNRLFFDTLWDHFKLKDWLHLFIAKFEGKPVSAALAIVFKDTVHLYRLGWIRGYNHFHPNEGMAWHIMKWANEHQYHWVDFGGIDLEVAEAVLNGAELPEWVSHSYNGFKLQVSEDITLFPGTVEYFSPRVLSDLIHWLSRHQTFNLFLKNFYRQIRRR
jgi:lipid II:glycine glycyltransferase (peptidoglycan interpeptide bridge formation enzyme)